MERSNGKLINSSTKDYWARAKSYSNPEQALNEPVVNAFFAKGRNNIILDIFEYNNVECIAVANDGEAITQSKMENIIGQYGCDSDDTPGNENGTGLKTCSSYFSDRKKESFLTVVSKAKNGGIVVGLIDSDGMTYSNIEDLTESDAKFINYLKSEYLDDFPCGSVTAIYAPSHLDEFNDVSYAKVINDEFTHGLKDVNFVFRLNGEGRTITYVDELYEDVNDDTIKRNNFETSFTWEVPKENGLLVSKVFHCSVKMVDTHAIENRIDYFNHYDEIEGSPIHTYGFMCGYDDGYMPLYASRVEKLGFAGKQQYYRTRAYMFAHPCSNPNDENNATNDDWKKFYSAYGKMSAQKVPNYDKPFNFRWGDKLNTKWESFYTAVIEKVRQSFNDWMPDDERESISEDFVSEIASDIKTKLHFRVCGATFTPNIKEFIGDEDIFVKYEVDTEGNRYIMFNANHSKFKNKKKHEDTFNFVEGCCEVITAMVGSSQSVGDAESDIKRICKKLNYKD